MRPNYVLIDYENVQPDSLGLLDREEFRIRLFIGANQASLKRNVAIAMQKLGPAKAEYVEISGNGPNALDFHIAYYIGCLSAMDKDAFFHIISKDTGFDPLIAHLKSRKVFCQRSVRIEDIPLLRTLSAASAIEQADAVIDNLRRRGNARPRLVKTLRNTIAAIFANKLDERELDVLLKELQQRGVVAFVDQKVNYSIPDA
ncbi:MAG: hypothetical protein J0L89_04560 [Xanthomonadales bacterium]|nr:hypothetical protein [Xanthomonadales bacterium]MCA0198402.1 hypothetical protein [Pseudomonadota bacterium]HRF83554.1 PIN domain-containing protein [Pseudoxanthomonas sp.]